MGDAEQTTTAASYPGDRHGRNLLSLDGTDHANHTEQNSMIRRYIAWRNRHTHDAKLRRVVERANIA